MAPLGQYSVILLMVISFLTVSCKSKEGEASVHFLRTKQSSKEGEASVQIVYMANSKVSAASHIQILASVLGSEIAAKKAIIYEYTKTVNGFAALLTADQINALLNQPAVLRILPGGFENVVAVSSTP